MTFGKKLKQARTKATMSQEELAQKLGVSRSAVAKWETDKGLPDIPNLKAIAATLNISVDYLLDDGTKLELSTIRKPVDLSAYGKGRKKVLKDKAVRAAYPNAEIMTLLAEEKLTRAEKAVNTALWIFTPLIDILPFTKGLNNLDNEFYLVNDGTRQYLVRVTAECMESIELAERVTDKKFEHGNYKFVNCGPIRYA